MELNKRTYQWARSCAHKCFSRSLSNLTLSPTQSRIFLSAQAKCQINTTHTITRHIGFEPKSRRPQVTENCQCNQWGTHGAGLVRNKGKKKNNKYPDKQTVLSVWEEGSPYSNAFSSSSFVAVTLLTGGEEGLGAETTSCRGHKQTPQHKN